jgi:hypothetical protein
MILCRYNNTNGSDDSRKKDAQSRVGHPAGPELVLELIYKLKN